jgi:propionyl-CoA carboxylase beta chain
VVPRLAAIVGPCADEALWSPALADVALEVAGRAAVPTGLAHLVADDEAGCWRMVRALLSYLPSHSGETPPFRPTADPADRADAELQTLAPDPFEVAVRVLDEGRFLEIQPSAARDVLVGFGRLAGHAVGVLANRPGPGPEPEPEDVEAATKAARFVRLCDRFNVPLVSLVDSPGGSVAGGAGLIQACAEATVPRLTVITRRARGGAYVLAASRQMGADLCLAWPSAEIAAADAYGAAERGYVDAVIEPRDTRRLLVRGLELCLRRP